MRNLSRVIPLALWIAGCGGSEEAAPGDRKITSWKSDSVTVSLHGINLYDAETITTNEGEYSSQYRMLKLCEPKTQSLISRMKELGLKVLDTQPEYSKPSGTLYGTLSCTVPVLAESSLFKNELKQNKVDFADVYTSNPLAQLDAGKLATLCDKLAAATIETLARDHYEVLHVNPGFDKPSWTRYGTLLCQLTAFPLKSRSGIDPL
jgi:hypothetical protein